MKKTTDPMGSGRWIVCYWQENFETLDQLPRQAGLISPGVLMIPPPVEDITYGLGLWATLNEELGTLFDVAEEEDVPTEQLSRMAEIISRYAYGVRAGDSGIYRATVGRRVAPEHEIMIAEVSDAELGRHLQAIIDFLADAEAKRKAVTVSL